MPCFITIVPVDDAYGEVSFMSFILQHRDVISPQRSHSGDQNPKTYIFGQQQIYPVKIILFEQISKD